MRRATKLTFSFLTCLAMAAASTAWALFLWLPSPSGRNNPNDPKSVFFVRPTTVPTQAQPSATLTVSPTQSPFESYTPTYTVSPVFSPTASPTQTTFISPTQSTTSTPTPILTPTHGSLVDDFENNAANANTLWNGGSIYTVKDGNGSSIVPDPWTASSGSTPGAYGSSVYSACISGSLVTQNTGLGIYPFSYIGFDLIPNGGQGPGAGGVNTNVLAYSPNHGIQFDYQAGAGAVGVQYEIQLISTLVTDLGYYSYFFTPSDTSWHTQVIYFPDVIGSTQVFSQPSWAAYVPWDATQIGSIFVKVVASNSGPVTYALCMDNITFSVPTALPTPTVGTSTMVMSFANNTANDQTLAPFGQAVSTYNDAGGTTLVPNPWTSSSGTTPGQNIAGEPASTFCGCISGTIAQQKPSATPPYYPAANIQFLLANLGYGGGGGFFNLTSPINMIPNNRLVFDYKAGNTTTNYIVQVVTQNITDYNYYQYQFVATNTNWNTLAVNFPGSPFGPQLSQVSWATPKPFMPSEAGAIVFQVVPSNASALPFNLCLDNIRFN